MREKTALRPLLPFLVDHRPRGIRFPPWTQRALAHLTTAPRASSLRDGKFTHSENSVDERESFGNFVVGTLEEDFPENVYVYLYIHTLEKPDLARVDYDFQLLGTLARFSPSFPISGDPTRAFGTRSGLKVKCRIVAGQTVALVNGRLRGEKVEGGSPSCIHLV